MSPLKFPPTSTFAWGLFLRKAAVGGGGRFGSGTGTPPETPALPRSHSWREGGDPLLRRPELPPPAFPTGRGTGEGAQPAAFLWALLFGTHCPREGQAPAFQGGSLGFQRHSQRGRQGAPMEGAWGSEGARSQDPNAPPQGEASSWLRGTDQRCRSEQRHLRSGAFPTREQFKKKKKNL